MEIYGFEFPQGSRFLVTGGAGFIGSNLAERILELGYDVTVLDNFSTGSEENLRGLRDSSRFSLIVGDICNPEDCRKACEKADYVLHQAALGSVPRSIEDPAASNASNVCGTLNMLVAARDCNVRRFVFASSSAVYGDARTLPKREDITGKPLSPYAITKLTGELYARNFFELFGLPAIGLRYFNVFGKRQDPHSRYSAVIPRFAETLLRGERPIIYGDGTQSRDFTYVENVVEANLLACLAGEAALGEVFNIGCEDSISINDLYTRLCRLLKVDIPPVYGAERSGDIRQSYADTTKAKKLLKYDPRFSFQQGLELYMDWYKNYRR